MADCPVCKGRGCDACGKTGRFEITQCPMLLIERSFWDLMDMVDFYEKGIPPVVGGLLDQTAWFVAFARQVFDEERPYKARQEF